ncbi:MAG: hypothetical protein NVV74_22445 [Magnetospirillum sp.]|nr:hypothetical protein [Magnetospirillum sp.]
MVNKSHQDRTARLASGAFEAQVAEIDQRISALQQELGPIGAEEWGPEREGPNIAPILSMLA